ncbi:MAG: NAD-dependent epimerase/dehydratase family protein [Sphingomonas sp.]
MTILVTGGAGFIGYHVAAALAARGDAVVAIDNLNDYYPVALKRARLAALGDAVRFVDADFSDADALGDALRGTDIDHIVHLGAQPGVRYSIENPRAYAASNLLGHLNILELARARAVKHLVYASSSSVYGNSTSLPFRVEDRADHPVSLYAATKKADELMSESYAHLYRLPQTGLRFFTVYGPWGRPDMAVWLFTAAVLEGRPIKVFNHGKMQRDCTYIDDIVAGVIAALDRPPADDGALKAGGSVSPHALYNIGNHRAEELGRLIEVIEQACGREAIRDYQPMQPGDVHATFADISAIQRDLGFTPSTPIDVGVPRFVDWYRGYAAV